MQKSEKEWRKILTPQQFAVLRDKATEPPFSGEYDGLHADGVYACAACGQYCLIVSLSLMPAVAGQVFTMQNLRLWSFTKMTVLAWYAPR